LRRKCHLPRELGEAVEAEPGHQIAIIRRPSQGVKELIAQ
jgi:hypothetical protein